LPIFAREAKTRNDPGKAGDIISIKVAKSMARLERNLLFHPA